MWKTKHLLFVLGATLLMLSACNLPQANTPDPNAAITVAAQTIQAQLTQDALSTPLATLPPAATSTPQPPTITNPPPNTPTATPICDLALFVADVSVPDGSVFLPDTAFTKAWRLKNIGVCTWSSSYQLVFDTGESMSGPATQPLAGPVAPGQMVDISVNLKAPSAVNAYRGYWKLRNQAGVIIPITNGAQGSSFYVDIKVVLPTGTPTLTLTPTLTTTATPTSTTNP